jgi:tetratricopeptide (TPR) repeat protein
MEVARTATRTSRPSELKRQSRSTSLYRRAHTPPASVHSKSSGSSVKVRWALFTRLNRSGPNAASRLGNVRAAESTAREALALYRQTPTDQAVVNALIALSHALIAQRRHDEAVPYLREALGIVEQHSPIRFLWFKGEIQSTLGSVLAAQGQPTEAERLLLAGYESLRTVHSTPPPRLRAALERLVSFYVANGRSAEAVSWRTRS